jgi:Holliday junction resolvase
MKHDVRRRLQEISSAKGQEYGKIVQKLLAIAFLQAGAARLTERSTQGIDLEVELADGRRLALEVKTSQSEKVSFGTKDVKGLCERQSEGKTPYLALLGPRALDNWIFARFVDGEILPNRDYALTALRAYRDTELEDSVREAFAATVVEHATAAIAGGQAALDVLLRRYPRYATA